MAAAQSRSVSRGVSQIAASIGVWLVALSVPRDFAITSSRSSGGSTADSAVSCGLELAAHPGGGVVRAGSVPPDLLHGPAVLQQGQPAELQQRGVG